MTERLTEKNDLALARAELQRKSVEALVGAAALVALACEEFGCRVNIVDNGHEVISPAICMPPVNYRASSKATVVWPRRTAAMLTLMYDEPLRPRLAFSPPDRVSVQLKAVALGVKEFDEDYEPEAALTVSGETVSLYTKSGELESYFEEKEWKVACFPDFVQKMAYPHYNDRSEIHDWRAFSRYPEEGLTTEMVTGHTAHLGAFNELLWAVEESLNDELLNPKPQK